MPIPSIVSHQGSITAGAFDAAVVLLEGDRTAFTAAFPELAKDLSAAESVDSTVGQEVGLIVSTHAPGHRFVVAPTGPLTRDYDDVTRLADAVKGGLGRALRAGSRTPLIVLNAGLLSIPGFANAIEVVLLGAYQALYHPIQAREARGEAELENVNELGFHVFADPAKAASIPSEARLNDAIRFARATELGRRVARDIGGGDPERMAALRIVEYVQAAFADVADLVKITVIEDRDVLLKEFPLFESVARCSYSVPRHRPAVVRLEYGCPETANEFYYFVGKGVTYDTGGADIKAGGHMAGMSRDKCGAAAVAGLFRTAAELRPQGVRLVGYLGLARNSVGSDAYVSDEIIKSRAGVLVRIGNTDAEGRMVMSDLLAASREELDAEVKKYRAKNSKDPVAHAFTIATLTGHACLAVGPYSIAVDNGPARDIFFGNELQKSGQLFGDLFEVSTLRKEDYSIVNGGRPTRDDDISQCNSKPSSQTARGHQFPAAFMILASGLDKNARNTDVPLRYTHLDIAGASEESFLGKPTAVPIVALASHLLLPHSGLASYSS